MTQPGSEKQTTGERSSDGTVVCVQTDYDDDPQADP